MDAQQQAYGGARGPGGAGAAAPAAESTFPWGAVAIGGGVLLGGGLFYRWYKKKHPSLGGAAAKPPVKPGTTATPAKPATSTYKPPPLPGVPKVTMPTINPIASPPSGYGQPPPGYGPSQSSSPSGATPEQLAELQAKLGITASQAEALAQQQASSKKKYSTDSTDDTTDASADAASSDDTSSGGLYIGSVRVDSVRTVDDVRRHLHKALCDHPDYRGIGFCKVGGEVGIAVASKNRPLHLPGRIGGVPIVAGCC